MCLVLATLGCGSGEAARGPSGGPPPPSVEVTVIEPEVLIDVVALTGQLYAENEVVLKPEIAGVVASIEFEEGQPVAAGDVLVTLRDEVQVARLQESRAELRLARGTFERENKLARKDASSLARTEEVRSGLDTAKAHVALAQIALDRTRIQAPFDGVVGVRLVAPGQRVDDEDGLVSLAAIDRLQLLFTVQEMGVALARVGAPIHARVVSWPGERFAGEVFFVSPTIDPATRRLVLKAWVPNPDHRLKPGMFANVDIQIARREGALVVPEAAMVYDRNGSYVWRVIDGPDGAKTAEKVPVVVGLRKLGRVEITAGIQPGDAVVSAGTNKVMAGKRIVVVDAGGTVEGTAHAAEGAQRAPVAAASQSES